jgi:hypothetical protein
MCYTIQDSIASLQEEIFKRIQNDNEGEMDEVRFHELVQDDVMHQECDDLVVGLWSDEIMDILAEYGFQEAIQLYIDNFGSFRTAPTTRALVYLIIYEKTQKHVTLTAYNEYCEQNPL